MRPRLACKWRETSSHYTRLAVRQMYSGNKKKTTPFTRKGLLQVSVISNTKPNGTPLKRLSWICSA
jgi:hypothetical protein